jgi:hypothetical protein
MKKALWGVIVALWACLKALPKALVCVLTGKHDWRDGWDFCQRCGKYRERP